MPFYTGLSEQTETIETIDLLQTIVDECGLDAPLMILGDFNTSFPQSPILKENWHLSRPFNKYSYILHEIICFRCGKLCF